MSQVKVSDEFKELVRLVGSDFSLTQGVGGNSSVKANGSMVVKASGRRLADIDSSDYFYEVSLSNGQFVDSLPGQRGKPSIEVFLHALLPDKYVLHLHSTRAVALSMIASTSQETAREIIENGITLLPYARPGVELSRSISTQLSTNDRSTFLLTNHGSLFQANSVQKLADLIRSFENFAELKLEKTRLFKLETESMDAELSHDIAKHLSWHAQHNWRISPDHVVFLGTHAPRGFLENLREGVTVRDLLDSTSLTGGLIGPLQEQLLWFLNVTLSLPLKTFTTLSETEAIVLQSWEAEKHRLRNSLILPNSAHSPKFD